MMNKKLGRLLRPNMGWYISVMLAFAIASAAFGYYLLAGLELVVTAAVFVLYLLFATFNVAVLKWIMAIIAIVGAALCLGFLYLSGELMKKRSLWMTMSFGAIALLTLVSLICKVPMGPVA